MELGTTINQPLHGRRLKSGQRADILLEFLKERAVPNQRDFDGFDITRAFKLRRLRSWLGW